MDADDLFGGAMAIASETSEAEAEREFEKVLQMLREAEGMQYYSDVYTKLYDSYYKMKDVDNRHVQELEAFKSRMGKFNDTVTQYRTEIKKTIETLRAEVEEARKLAAAMRARELLSVESLETMKRSGFQLKKELDASKGADDNDAGATSAVEEKERFEKEKARLAAELDSVKHRLENALSYQEELDRKNSAAEEHVAKLEVSMEEAENSAVGTGHLVEHLDNESSTLQQEVEARGATVSALTEKLAKAEKTLERRDKQIKEMAVKLETAQAEQEASNLKAANLRLQLDKTNVDLEKIKQQLNDTGRENKNLIADNQHHRNEISKLNEQVDISTKSYQLLEEVKADLEGDRDRLRQQITEMERVINLGKKQTESDKREIENLKREKEILWENMQKTQKAPPQSAGSSNPDPAAPGPAAATPGPATAAPPQTLEPMNKILVRKKVNKQKFMKSM